MIFDIFREKETEEKGMIKIAVLDDEPIFLEKISRKVDVIYKECHIKSEVDRYSNGKVLLDEVKDGKRYDIYVLDVEVPGISGVELGRQLREISEVSFILFLTAYPQYAIEGYDSRAYKYILKDEWEDRLEEALKKIQKEIDDWNAPSYRITINDRLEKIPVKHIYYAKKDGKNVVFYTREGKSSIRKTLAQVYAELPDGDFIYVDRSYLVNLEHVMKLKHREVYMANGDIVPVSYPRLEQVKKGINAYWRSHV